MVPVVAPVFAPLVRLQRPVVFGRLDFPLGMYVAVLFVVTGADVVAATAVAPAADTGAAIVHAKLD